ncbi:UDP-N-acetylmuramoyl-L-alanyl-D-glutamate--2,6-diaminopimelate ligase [Helicobacter muridarum]|nr:UDP-N-acetylmuramoyl-L-alanyl-D-glutamate--2,6-diaminopimelate ligase [Helicobacter muridarum]TLD99554.1 UDP-N-acetylmuramoyl-L-alanyl-D-glutamate--2,6-diaminopimelate ligase [Helicobacter muridarum]
MNEYINYKDTNFVDIIDDTRLLNLSKDSNDYLFLQTPQNEQFVHTLPAYIRVIQRDSLHSYFNTDIKIIGVTGTNGKTTTTAAIYSLLLDSGCSVALLGTRGMFINGKRIKPKGLTTPTLLELYKDIDIAVKAGCEYFIMEVSSHAIKQERIYGLRFFMKIITNITSDHLDYHKTWEDYAETKIRFLRDQECIKIINLDDSSVANMRFLKNVFSYGVESKGNLFVNAYSLNQGIFAGIMLVLPQLIKQKSIDSKTLGKSMQNSSSHAKTQEATLNIGLFGLFNLYNSLAALLAVKLITKASLQNVCNLFENFGGVEGRMEVISTDPLIIIDFAHTTDGMKQVFESFKTRNISVVFGAGGDRDKSKRAKMGECAAIYAKRIYITNDNPRGEDPNQIAKEILAGVRSRIATQYGLSDSGLDSNMDYIACSRIFAKVILDRKDAISLAIKEMPKDYVLLVLGKGDEDVQIFKDNKIPFSDKKCVLEVLNNI